MDEQFLKYLQSYHTGKVNAVISKELEVTFGLKNREIRLIVNSLRNEGHPICSSGNGYYYARDETEVIHAIGNLNSRIIGIALAKNGLTKSLVAFQEDTCQLSLITAQKQSQL